MMFEVKDHLDSFIFMNSIYGHSFYTSGRIYREGPSPICNKKSVRKWVRLWLGCQLARIRAAYPIAEDNSWLTINVKGTSDPNCAWNWSSASFLKILKIVKKIFLKNFTLAWHALDERGQRSWLLKSETASPFGCLCLQLLDLKVRVKAMLRRRTDEQFWEAVCPCLNSRFRLTLTWF